MSARFRWKLDESLHLMGDFPLSSIHSNAPDLFAGWTELRDSHVLIADYRTADIT